MSGLETTADERARLRRAYETCGFGSVREMKVLRDLEACLGLLRTLVQWNETDDGDTDDVLRIAAKAGKLLGPEVSR